MLDIIDLSIQYGGKELFENVNLKINPSDKIALIGSNGTGKSTLLKLISGKETPEAGKIQYQKGLKIGYLPQEILNKSLNIYKKRACVCFEFKNLISYISYYILVKI